MEIFSNLRIQGKKHTLVMLSNQNITLRADAFLPNVMSCMQREK